MRGDFDVMADTLENIKSEIKCKVVAKGRKEFIENIETYLTWYRNKEKVHSVKTPSGLRVNYPADMPITINEKLTLCFELLITELDKLGLL